MYGHCLQNSYQTNAHAENLFIQNRKKNSHLHIVLVTCDLTVRYLTTQLKAVCLSVPRSPKLTLWSSYLSRIEGSSGRITVKLNKSQRRKRKIRVKKLRSVTLELESRADSTSSLDDDGNDFVVVVDVSFIPMVALSAIMNCLFCCFRVQIVFITQYSKMIKKQMLSRNTNNISGIVFTPRPLECCFFLSFSFTRWIFFSFGSWSKNIQ